MNLENNYYQKVYSVGNLNKDIKNILEGNTSFKNIGVRGEIINLTTSNNHIFFTLKDEDQNQKASIRCTFFAYERQSCSVNLKEHMKVIIYGNISVYVPKGSYSIIVRDIEERGIGKLLMQIKTRKEKYQKLGYFNPDQKQKINKCPDAIGVVSSTSGAGLQDIIKTIHHRLPSCQIFVFSCLVQGNQSAPSIAKAIAKANHFHQTKQQLDTLIVGRGGGSFEDLLSFNDPEVIEAIYKSKIPIISGVGHETDHLLSDLVADKIALTPTNAAEIATKFKKNDLLKILAQSQQTNYDNIMQLFLLRKSELKSYKDNYIFQNSKWIFTNIKNKINKVTTKFNQLISRRLIKLKSKCEIICNNFKSMQQNYVAQIHNNFKKYHTQSKQTFTEKKEPINNFLKTYWFKLNQIVMNNKQSLNKCLQNYLFQLKDIFTDTTRKLWSKLQGSTFNLKHNFLKAELFHRGYSLTTINNQNINNIKDIADNSILKTWYAQGLVYSKFIKKENH